MRTNQYLVPFFSVILLLQAGCLYPIRYDGPYHGRVVDEQSREPIEGAVVLGSWWVYHFDIGGGHSTYHDAREAVTDQKGKFTITGEGLRIFSSLQPMRFIIYKSGHTYFQGSWDTLTTGIYTKQVVKWEGDIPIIPLRKLTEEERRRDGLPSRPDIPEYKMKSITNEINKERIFKGYRPLESSENHAK